METEVLIWWVFLMATSVANLAIWRLSAKRVGESKTNSESAYRSRRAQLMLSAVFALGCAFRSFFPRADVQRIVLVDSWLSSVFVGRTVATVAELAFAAQWALLLKVSAEQSGSRPCAYASKIVLPLIAFAECASWYAVLTTNFLGNVIEQSCWTFGAVLVVLAFVSTRRHVHEAAQRFVLATALIGGSYIAFMVKVDIAMYFARWQEAQLAGVSYLDPWQGLTDAALRWAVTHAFVPWQDEMAWMALYFSVAVWISLFLAHAPTFARRGMESVSPEPLRQSTESRCPEHALANTGWASQPPTGFPR